ncbi:MAG: hypothetical protein ACTHOE_06425 [Conexibacter sp.]
MTLVTALKSTGVPTMIGDFLITDSVSQVRGRKKISRLRPNLAVGWTGRLVQAEMVLRSMYDDLGERPTRATVQACLESYDVRHLGNPQLKLVGGVVDDNGAHAFHWDAAAPLVYWGGPWFVGTGSAWIENIYDRYMRASADARPDEKDALDWIMGALSELNIFDVYNRSTHRLGFGGGYEALYWSSRDASFRYVEQVLYFLVGCRVDANGAVSADPEIAVDDMAHYQTMGECSVFTFSRPVEGSDYTMWGMSPVGMPWPREEAIGEMFRACNGPMNMEADYYAATIAVSGPNAIAPMTPFIQCPWDRRKLIRGTRGRVDVELPHEMFEVLFRERAVPTESIPDSLKPLTDLLRHE